MQHYPASKAETIEDSNIFDYYYKQPAGTRLKFGIWSHGSQNVVRNLHLLEAMGAAQIESVMGANGYRPILVPIDAHGESTHWLHTVQQMMHAAAYGVVAELWLSQLEQRKERIESPTWVFWNGAIPKPNPLTALFWFLVCESWPYQRQDYIDELEYVVTPSELSRVFPMNSFVLPFSPDMHRLSNQPQGYAYSPTRVAFKFVEGRDPPQVAFGKHITREDRARSNRIWSNIIHAIVYRHGIQHSVMPRATMDSGHALFEVEESHEKLSDLVYLRREVMHDLLMPPGLPTNGDNLFEYPGGWLYTWSSHGFAVKTIDADSRESLRALRQWTSNGGGVKFSSEVTLTDVPYITPRIWLGWDSVDAQQEWVDAYMYHRPLALLALFDPAHYDVASAIANHIEMREKRIKKLGVVTKGGDPLKAFKAGLDTLKLNW